MRLSDEDAKLFYRLWLPLLDYVNEKRGINSNLRDISLSEHLNPIEVKEIADVLWEDVSLIDEYLSGRQDIVGDDREIISGWKRCVRGQFILERILKNGAILISLENDSVYQVSGIISSWKEMFGYAHLPLMIQAALIPFRDIIISDGLIQTYNVMIGRNLAGTYKDTYMYAKKSGWIHRQI